MSSAFRRDTWPVTPASIRTAFFVAAASMMWSAPARACSIRGMEEVTPVADPEDEAPPGRVVEVSVDVRRGVGPKGSGCGGGGSTTSCDDLGRVSLEIKPPEDDRTPAAEMAYRLELADGHLPEGLSLPSGPIRAPHGVTQLTFAWIDGATDEQESVRFSLRIIAVDATGREGPASEPVPVHSAGRDGGCAVVGGLSAGRDGGCACVGARSQTHSLWLLALAGLALRVRRRTIPSAWRRPFGHGPG